MMVAEVCTERWLGLLKMLYEDLVAYSSKLVFRLKAVAHLKPCRMHSMASAAYEINEDHLLSRQHWYP